MKKSNLLLGSLMGLALTVTGVAAVATGFPDLPTDHWASQAILNLKTSGVIQGYTNGTFGPNLNVTRAEAAVMIDKNNAVWMKKMEAMTQEINLLKKELGLESEEWKTYTNEEFNFSFNYPSTWDIAEEDGHILLDPNEVKDGFEEGVPAKIGMAKIYTGGDVKNTLGMDDFLTVLIGYNDSIIAKKISLTSDDIPYPGEAHSSFITYYIARPTTTIIDDLEIIYSAKTDDANLQVMEEIIQTIKLTNAEMSVNLSESETWGTVAAEVKTVSEKSGASYLNIDTLNETPKVQGIEYKGETYNNSTKLREVKVTAETKYFECGPAPYAEGTKAGVTSNVSTFVTELKKAITENNASFERIYDFDLDVDKIEAIYERCYN